MTVTRVMFGLTIALALMHVLLFAFDPARILTIESGMLALFTTLIPVFVAGLLSGYDSARGASIDRAIARYQDKNSGSLN